MTIAPDKSGWYVTKGENGFVVVSARPEAIARWLIRDHKLTGAASGSIERLARQAAIRRYPSLKERQPYQFVLKVLPPEGKHEYEWGWSGNNDILSAWTNLYPRPVVDGYVFGFQFPYADLPATLGLSKADKAEKAERRSTETKYSVSQKGQGKHHTDTTTELGGTR